MCIYQITIDKEALFSLKNLFKNRYDQRLPQNSDDKITMIWSYVGKCVSVSHLPLDWRTGFSLVRVPNPLPQESDGESVRLSSFSPIVVS